ncbi:hypothetical protein [Synechococcus sp. MIT S9503]|uniref:hypothetical protein n=1 Tax=Synechococcus sp. MIT S9503 TaxID=3082547 RepID=UPI0039A5854F
MVPLCPKANQLIQETDCTNRIALPACGNGISGNLLQHLHFPRKHVGAVNVSQIFSDDGACFVDIDPCCFSAHPPAIADVMLQPTLRVAFNDEVSQLFNARCLFSLFRVF